LADDRPDDRVQPRAVAAAGQHPDAHTDILSVADPPPLGSGAVTGRVILGIAAGTTGVRTFAIDDASTVVRSAYREFPQYFPEPGWVEHDPEEIWAATL